ncbi:MAG TPA: hypothetical protein EYP04_12685 [Anaerolineae bacterium]|nr:hypothetical protein [Anaerolineae bacterium]
MGRELTQVSAFEEIFRQVGETTICKQASRHKLHAACPVPVGILKAIEVAAELALPADVHITITQENT